MKSALALYVLTALLVATAGEAAGAEGDYLVYVGSYTNAPSSSNGICAWRFEPSSGKVTSLGLVARTVNPAYICATPDGRFLYAVNWQTPEAPKGDTVTAYPINKNTGTLTFLNKVSAGGGLPNQVIVDPHGTFAMVANYGFHGTEPDKQLITRGATDPGRRQPQHAFLRGPPRRTGIEPTSDNRRTHSWSDLY